MHAFIPALVFFVMAPLSVSLALWLAFAAAFAVGIRPFVASGHVRTFDGVGFLMFAGLAFYVGFVQPGMTVVDTSIVVASGCLVAALWSMSLGKPFTSEYRLLRLTADPRREARAHTLLTAIWATCFAAMAGLDACTVVLHELSSLWATAFGLFLFAAALAFTWQYGSYIDKSGEPIPIARKR